MGPMRSSRGLEASVRLPPGVQHLSLWVGDARGGNDEVHFDVTVGSTPPDIDVASFLVGPNPLIPDRLQTLSASIRLDDADGSTQNLTLEVIFDDQRWSMAMSDEDGDGVWKANLVASESEGRPLVESLRWMVTGRRLKPISDHSNRRRGGETTSSD